MTDFDLGRFHQTARPEKAGDVNELSKQAALAILEIARRMDLRPDELAYATLGAVGVILRNRGGEKMLAKNLRTFAGKLYDYAQMVEAGRDQPDKILM